MFFMLVKLTDSRGEPVHIRVDQILQLESTPANSAIVGSTIISFIHGSEAVVTESMDAIIDIINKQMRMVQMASPGR